MAYGFMATNGNSQILVSDTCKNFHYMGKIVVYNATNISIGYGTNIHTNGGGKKIHYYRFSMPDTVTIPLLFFTMPSTSSYYAISKQYSVGVNWEIEIISYANAVSPEVYIFSELTSRSKAFSSWGIKINSSSQLGGPAFDSRFTPLVIKTTMNVVAPPNNCFAGIPTSYHISDNYGEIWQSAGYWNWIKQEQFNPNIAMYNGEFNAVLSNTASYGYSPGITLPTKPMYHYSSFQVSNIYQIFSGVYTQVRREGVFSWLGLRISMSYTWHKASSKYWAIFRNGIKMTSNNIYTGWIPELYGFIASYSAEKDKTLGWGGEYTQTVIGLNPVSTPNFNESVTNPVIIADAGFYDNQSTSGYTFFN